MKIHNLYSRPYETNKYTNAFVNVPVERFTYYPQHGTAYCMVATKDSSGKTTKYICEIPEALVKVCVGHMSNGRRVSFFTDRNHSMGHIFFGEESHVEIKKQIESGLRPMNWGDPNSKDWDLWKSVQQQMKCSPLSGGSRTYGFAQIIDEGAVPKLGFVEE